MLKLTGINKAYRAGEHELRVLRDVSLTIEQGEYVAIMGPSGSGKSTLMNLLGLLDTPTSGTYEIQGQNTANLDDDGLARLRGRTIGFVFQQFHLLPRLSSAENVALPLLYAGFKPDPERAHPLLGKLGLEARLDHRPTELSGGQQQRVAIARALVNQPLLVLADEPTGNLDSHSEKEVLEVLRGLHAQGITVVVVTHEESVGEQADRLIRMKDGQIVSDERKAPPPPKLAKQKQPPSGRRVAWPAGEYLAQGVRTLLAHRMRTLLSMLGIFIGVLAVITMLALGSGAQKSVENQLSSLGSNLLVVRPGARRVGGVAQESGAVTRLSVEDANMLRQKVGSAEAVSASVSGRVQVIFGNKNWSTQVSGVDADYLKMHAQEPIAGRAFTEEEVSSRARVALIGATVVRNLFGRQNPVGEQIKINKLLFQVIGVLPEKGASGFRDQDDVVVIPLSTGMYRLLGKTFVDNIEVQVRSAGEMDGAEASVITLLRAAHRIPASQEESGFEVMNLAELQSAISESSRTMSLLLAAIATVSLLVGGIGIMNIMMVSVAERTKEIGLRKALDATRADILTQFLVESILVSSIGGIAGILGGVVLSLGLTALAGWAASVTSVSVLLAFTFSAGVGVVFGIYPARKASALHPIEALRRD